MARGLLLLLLAVLLSTLEMSPRAAAAAEKKAGVKVTVYLVWVSEATREEKPPKDLEPFAEQLKKSYKRHRFRLEGKPVSDVLRGEKTLEVKLPQDYQTRWSVVGDADRKPRLRQVIVNPKKVEAVALIKKSPAITHIEKIRSGEETFLLIVQFEEEAT